MDQTNKVGNKCQAVPLVHKVVLAAGIQPGGEGGQWPQAIGIDPVDGKFLLYGTDVGGIFRSLDGGREAIAIGVHPTTRYAYVGTGCYGFWKFSPPAAKSAQ